MNAWTVLIGPYMAMCVIEHWTMICLKGRALYCCIFRCCELNVSYI